jgi:hypothetical protein
MNEKMVESEVLAWCFAHGWSADVYDSKGEYSESLGRYRSSKSLKTGTSDVIAATDMGHAAYIELKKTGHDHTCRLEQRQFLERKIASNAFACVVSSAKQLNDIYSEWLALPIDKRRIFLLSKLPRKVLVNKKILHLS